MLLFDIFSVVWVLIVFLMGQSRPLLFIFVLSHFNTNDKYTIWTISIEKA